MSSPIRIPLLDLRRIAPALEKDLEAAFHRVLTSGHYILGPEVDAFETECAAYVDSQHAIGVSSGTDALLIALMALGVGRDDEVICPSFTFFATAGTIWRLGARPVFVDSHPRCFNLDPEKLEAAFSPRTKAVMPVHLFGQCAEMTAIGEIAARHGVPVVEDAAQALGAEHAGRRAGTFGALGCFSFFPSKNLGALGDAGLVVTNDDALAEKVRILRAHGGKPKYYHAVVGGNFRIDALQAAVLRAKLPHLDAATERRSANARRYVSELSRLGIGVQCGEHQCSTRCLTRPDEDAAPILLPSSCGGRHVMNQFVIRIRGEGERDRVRRHLTERGIGTEVYYPVPLHLQECFGSLGYRLGDFPVAEQLARESLALPVFPELTTRELDFVVSALAEAITSNDRRA
ncbi:MAG TPA: DegT/DnrJ/EryC1/StrS family aminotransferase [Polyangiaceae bacterium]|nr:DegT/DnrJ/EryC1/StrS family aminotransferase [Polyangiaceae bacterium]